MSPRFDHRLSETIAGRRFLETLRQHHEEDEKIDTTEPNALNVRIASFGLGQKSKSDPNDLKRKRMTLRASLEELLVEYLRNLAPEHDDGSIGDRSRVKRHANPSNGIANDKESNTESDKSILSRSDVNNSSAKAANLIGDNNSVAPALLLNESIDANDGDDDNRVNATSSTPKNVCAERRQRISQLDRNELDAALQNHTDYEHNIRRLLNYR